ncbi:uncharacterized protein KY384_006601 [Bacidia gigantensis]|uniref:uncharacterized protein n=1 Tax=Bacidia gigantensis TaxID=2732470 RepID=UPI001D0420BE|nr:uncharacterized protein KY384_006601 [Bacidia gigantensis]KAG8528912.1 hypothetical protein KY384_006601 [Bacidia gigantensis]
MASSTFNFDMVVLAVEERSHGDEEEDEWEDIEWDEDIREELDEDLDCVDDIDIDFSVESA